MHKRNTGFNIEQLGNFIPLANEQNISKVSSFELPTIELIAREVGTILLISTDKEEKRKAENILIQLLEHSLANVRREAYFFFLEYSILKPNSLSEKIQKILHAFEAKSCNINIVKNVLSII